MKHFIYVLLKVTCIAHGDIFVVLGGSGNLQQKWYTEARASESVTA